MQRRQCGQRSLKDIHPDVVPGDAQTVGRVGGAKLLEAIFYLLGKEGGDVAPMGFKKVWEIKVYKQAFNRGALFRHCFVRCSRAWAEIPRNRRYRMNCR